MCGIVALTKPLDPKNEVIKGLSALEYRGYDSCGVAFLMDDGHFNIQKAVGGVKKLRLNVEGNVKALIAHNRWATHGKPSLPNAHPHLSLNKKVCLVHNGVIDNADSWRAHFEEEGYSFYGDTDSEIVADILEEHLMKGTAPLDALKALFHELEGSFALAIMFNGSSDIFFAKQGSSLYLSPREDDYLLASDVEALVTLGAQVSYALPDGVYGVLGHNKCLIYRNGEEVNLDDFPKQDLEGLLSNEGKGKYPHFMLKEIEEGIPTLERLTASYGHDAHLSESLLEEARNADCIVLGGCGSSYHACLAAQHFFKILLPETRVEVILASEVEDPFPKKSSRPFFFFLSQSGETADLIRLAKIVQREGYKQVALVNKPASAMTFLADYTLPLMAGSERAVASTKSYLAEVYTLFLLAYQIHDDKLPEAFSDSLFSNLKMVKEQREEIKKIAEQLLDHRDLYLVGKGIGEALSREAALKIKEVAYVHAESYASGEFKHGPIALLEEGVPIIAFDLEERLHLPFRSNLQELRARGAKIYTVSSSNLAEKGDAFILPETPYHLLDFFPAALFAQYLSYYLSLLLKRPIDFPRNLAKSVTVS